MSIGIILQNQQHHSDSVLHPKKFVWYQKKALNVYFISAILFYLVIWNECCSKL